MRKTPQNTAAKELVGSEYDLYIESHVHPKHGPAIVNNDCSSGVQWVKVSKEA